MFILQSASHVHGFYMVNSQNNKSKVFYLSRFSIQGICEFPGLQICSRLWFCWRKHSQTIYFWKLCDQGNVMIWLSKPYNPFMKKTKQIQLRLYMLFWQILAYASNNSNNMIFLAMSSRNRPSSMVIGLSHTLVPSASLRHKWMCQANNHGWRKSHYCTTNSISFAQNWSLHYS